LLSLAQSGNHLFCLEWTPSDTGPKILQSKKIRFNHTKSPFKNFLDYTFKNINKNSLNTSDSITISIDIDSVLVTSFNYDSNVDINEYIDWYKHEILNPYLLDNFDIYFYPLNNDENSVLVICINKKIKKNIIESCEKHKFDLNHLTIDVFSASSAINIYKKKNVKKYLLWKVNKNNYHYGLYYENNDLKHIIKIKKSNKIECIESIGDKKIEKDLIQLFESVLFKNKVNKTYIDKIFVYQTKTSSELIKKISTINKIVIMDIGSKVFKKKSNKKGIQFNLLGFNENSNSLRGIDV